MQQHEQEEQQQKQQLKVKWSAFVGVRDWFNADVDID